jgi:hypothetical protein
MTPYLVLDRSRVRWFRIHWPRKVEPRFDENQAT